MPYLFNTWKRLNRHHNPYNAGGFSFLSSFAFVSVIGVLIGEGLIGLVHAHEPTFLKIY